MTHARVISRATQTPATFVPAARALTPQPSKSTGLQQRINPGGPLTRPSLSATQPLRPSTSVRATPPGSNQRPPSPSPSDSSDPASTGSKDTQPGLRLALLAGLAVAAVATASSESARTYVIEIVQDLTAADSGFLGPAAFIGLYAVATVLLFPASVLTLAAGALFGPLKGTAIVSVASTLGASLAFLVSRYLAGPLVAEKLLEYPKLQAVVKGISAQGLKLVLLLRLSPVFPFNLLNYALGATSIGFGEFVVASWAGMLPGTFAYVFLGGAGRVAADAAASGAPQPAQLLLYGVGAIATLGVTKLAADAASKALNEQEQNEA